MSPAPTLRARVAREVLIFAGFWLLTCLMTWPWVIHLRDAVPDVGDPYLTSWILWWDFFQTFHDPLHLFNANIFYPAAYSLAFSENCYGVVLPLFPLFALGLRPLTVNGIAVLLGFALSGYGAFRLARTLTGSTGAAWVAGIGFAFTPFRFHHLSHVVYLSAGWIPLTLEALVLFFRKRSWRQAAWLGFAFFMNGLSCIHWLVLTALPLAASGIFLAFRQGIEGNRDLWRRGVTALGIGCTALLPFLIPYRRAAQLYSFVRSADEAREYSALPRHWLNADPHNQLWRGFSEFPAPEELCLFPGILLILLSFAALLFLGKDEGSEITPASSPNAVPVRWIRLLDVVALLSGTVAILASGSAPLVVRAFGHVLLKASDPTRAVGVLALCFGIRCWFGYPEAFTWPRGRNLRESLRARSRSDALGIGLIFFLLGFFGSLGMNFPFHRVLFEFVPIFRSIRAPSRWAMVGHLGLALLAGLGTLRLAERLARRKTNARAVSRGVFVVVSAALLFELRAAPLALEKGEADPDALTRALAGTPMRGGIVQLPSGTERHENYLYVLRAADHRRPLVNGVSGFQTPTTAEIEALTRLSPIPEKLLDVLERVPTSYLTVRESWLRPQERRDLHRFLAAGLGSGRLRFIRRFSGSWRDDLYALARVEPGARSQQELPWMAEGSAFDPKREDDALIGSIDAPSSDAIVQGPLRVAGWARLPGEDLEVAISIDGEIWSSGTVSRVPRPDVASALPRLGDCSRAGYASLVPFEPSDAGVHELSVVFRSRDGRMRHYPARRFTWTR